MMNLFRSAAGVLELEVTSGDIGKTLCLFTEFGIPLRQVRVRDCLTARFLVSRPYYRQICRICERQGDSLRICSRSGLWWKGVRLLHRPLLISGLAGILILFLFLPTRILFIRVEGNQWLPKALLLEQASRCGLRFGASRRQFQSEGFKNALLEKQPELSWAGVNTRGCTAILSVQERSLDKNPPDIPGISNIIASRDGVVTEGTALRGTLLCRPGQAVRAGQVLISGYTDCGSRIRAERASGEVFAETHRTVAAVLPRKRTKKTVRQETHRQWSLVIGKKRINLPWGSRILDTDCGRMYEEYYITLPGGFMLPIALAVDGYIRWDTSLETVSPEKARVDLTAFAEDYLRRHMIAGTVRNSTCALSQDQDRYCLQGQYLCLEMIGRSRQEKIGE